MIQRLRGSGGGAPPHRRTASRIQDVAPPPLTRPLTVLLAVTCALTASNVYLNQPLLADMAASLHVSEASLGTVPTATQIGYGLGILLMVPLGDVTDRRRLILVLMAAATAMMGVAALAPNLLWLIVAHALIGLVTPVPQLVLPLGVALAGADRQERTVGVLQGGLLVGLLVSRTYAGAIGEVFGWRAVYLCSFLLMVVLSAILWRALPRTRPAGSMPYLRLLRSLPGLLRLDPSVWKVCVSGALIGVVFGAFWVTLVFFLAHEYGYGPAVAGLFGLVAAASALSSPIAGRMVARYGARPVQIVLISTVIAGWLALLGGELWIGWLIVGVILLDIGAWGNQVANQATLFTLAQETHSRLNTLYFTFRYTGIAVGYLAGTLAWNTAGWTAVGLLSIAAAMVALPIAAGSATSRPSRLRASTEGA